MPRRKPTPLNESSSESFIPARTPDGRENQLISLAMDVAEQQMRDGTASPQLISHFLKMGSSEGRYKVQKLKREVALLEAKTQAVKASQHSEELYAKALEAMRSYGGSLFGGSDAE